MKVFKSQAHNKRSPVIKRPIASQLFLESIIGNLKSREDFIFVEEPKNAQYLDKNVLRQLLGPVDGDYKYKSFKKHLKNAENAYIKYRKAADIALEMLKAIPISDRVRLLFDHWAEDDNYGKMMKQHTRAIEKAISRIPDNLIPASFSLEPKNARRKKRSLVFFDPFVGNGDVLSSILRITAEQHARISEKPLDLIVYINDISPNMVNLAMMKLKRQNKILKNYKTRIKDIFSSEINFLDDAARKMTPYFYHPVFSFIDVAIISQTLDLLKGIETKNKALTLLHDCLKIGGNLIVIGEDPDRFTLSHEMDIISALLFETVFEPFGKNETENELKRIRNGRLMIIGESSEKIDEVHSAFIRVAQRIYRPSELGETAQNGQKDPLQQNGKSNTGQKNQGQEGAA